MLLPSQAAQKCQVCGSVKEVMDLAWGSAVGTGTGSLDPATTLVT